MINPTIRPFLSSGQAVNNLKVDWDVHEQCVL